MRENFDLHLFEFQNGVPIKSEKSFLYDYWNIFFQIYLIKMIEKFRRNIFETDFLSIKSLLKIKFNNTSKKSNLSNNVSKNVFLSNDIKNLLYGNTNNLNYIKSTNLSFYQISNQKQLNVSLLNNNISSNASIKKNLDSNSIKINYIPNENNINDILNLNIKKYICKSEHNITKLDSNIKFRTKYFQFPINQNIKNSNNINFRIEKNIQVKPTPYFRIQKSSLQNDNNLNNQFILKKRKRLIKNKKLVFTQFDRGTEQDDEKNYEKKRMNSPESFNYENYKKIFKRNAKSRSSIYRGVSKNGKHWQVLIMINKKKKYSIILSQK